MRCILLILDGLGDRGHAAFDGQTPLQMASTPNLDRLAALGMTGLYHPWLLGTALASEIAHFLLFGYDLKDLFIGAEGTLGIITGAVLKLFPKPKAKATGFAGATSVANIGKLFEIARRIGGQSLTSFEFIPRIGIEYVLRHGDQTRDPLASPHNWYVLVELSGQESEGGVDDRLEAILGEALEAELVDDAAIASSLGQAEDFWRLRELLSEVRTNRRLASLRVIGIRDSWWKRLPPSKAPVPFACCHVDRVKVARLGEKIKELESGSLRNLLRDYS